MKNISIALSLLILFSGRITDFILDEEKNQIIVERDVTDYGVIYPVVDYEPILIYRTETYGVVNGKIKLIRLTEKSQIINKKWRERILKGANK